MPSELETNRALWAVVNEQFTAEDARRRWAAREIGWGLFEHPESELRVLGDVGGAAVVELGAGTAYLSAGLVRSGAHPVAVDVSRAQLDTAHEMQLLHGVDFPLVEGDAEHVPLRSGSFDLVVSEYGAAPWCEPSRWLFEAARLLRPGGRLVFLTNSLLAALCVPAEGGPAEDRLLRPTKGLRPVTWPTGGVEHHPTHGEWIRQMRAAGFVVDALHELHARPGVSAPAYYDIVTIEWARQWPADDLWIASRPG